MKKPKVTSCMRLLTIMAVVSLFTQLSPALAEKIGYDENTEIVVNGVVQRESTHTYRGFANFFLKTDWRLFRVLTAPNWYFKKAHFKLKNGQKVEVIGSKFYGPDGSLCNLAKSIRLYPHGKLIRFRDEFARPVWTSGFRGKSSCMKIFLRGTGN